jgi:catechol 2,3-dioxygenase-like lactoylglutathione lyase family enzyme
MDVMTVPVRDPEAAVAWYRDVLGLVVLFTDRSGSATLVAPGHRGGALTLVPAGPPLEHPAPGFYVEHLDQAIAELTARGVPVDITVGSAPRWRAGRSARFRDLDGHVLELYS